MHMVALINRNGGSDREYYSGNFQPLFMVSLAPILTAILIDIEIELLSVKDCEPLQYFPVFEKRPVNGIYIKQMSISIINLRLTLQDTPPLDDKWPQHLFFSHFLA